MPQVQHSRLPLLLQLLITNEAELSLYAAIWRLSAISLWMIVKELLGAPFRLGDQQWIRMIMATRCTDVRNADQWVDWSWYAAQDAVASYYRGRSYGSPKILNVLRSAPVLTGPTIDSLMSHSTSRCYLINNQIAQLDWGSMGSSYVCPYVWGGVWGSGVWWCLPQSAFI